MKTRGFTLIEVLIVIAIIAILSAASLAFLGGGRNKGKDTALKSGMYELFQQMEQYYENNSNYGLTMAAATCPTTGGTIFATDNTVVSMIAQLRNSNNNGTIVCATGGPSSATSWAVVARTADGTAYWCVDSAQHAQTAPSTALGGGAATAVCP